MPKLIFSQQNPIHLPISRMFGIELEFFLIDNDGKIANKSDLIIQKLKKKLLETEIKPECGQSMVEISSFPHVSSREVFGKFFTDFESMVYKVQSNGMGIFHYGCYPGINNTALRETPRYSAKRKILGEREFSNEAKCIGFHTHYSLPSKSFNPLVNFFYLDIKPVKKDKILNLFNLYIALDPALTTLMQSSPYFDGKYLGKDSRIIVYRGDPMFNFLHAVYSKYPEFGTLNDYAPNFKILSERIMERTKKWNLLLKENNIAFSDFVKKEVSILDSTWKPVKVSQHGTLESRGSDMNTLSKIAAASIVIKNISKFIENKLITVMPSETGNNEPFKLEENKLYVPNQQKLKELHKNSVLCGFDNEEVYHYCVSLLKSVRAMISNELQDSLKVFDNMLEEKKTTSDKILDFVKRKQGYSDFKQIEEETAQEIAIRNSENIYKDLLITKKFFDTHHPESMFWG